MPLSQKITEDLKQAMKAKDHTRLSCLRLLKNDIKNTQVDKRGELKEEEIQMIITSLIRKGQEAVQEFRQGGREDLAVKEEEEIKILYGYLPEQLTSADIEGSLKEIISELSAGGLKDMGKVMGALRERYAGQMDFGKASALVKEKLGAG